ncbi:TetR/AcrR family transcriptional regulator [Streptococcus pacificus]|uniref:TetR/AcrR family transcriptional regulator n=1 Tax=Streptococcus pacificus TaxID=2740577 RepID=A0ABS0ZJV6_9STRE|nr:TetR/AcrR family transcriptional regulator [Streptococcus pacificus]MBJ8326241.1 TetR/AcrR family transcriptional regulator [Streptococcus pacificus]
MTTIFEQIDKEKRKRIAIAAFEEFAKNGYDNASTNQVVKHANISKGILFHYFGNKKGLYDQLVDYSIVLIKEHVSDHIDWKERDFFNRIQQIMLLKVQLVEDYPYIYEFQKRIFLGKTQKDMLKIAGEEATLLAQRIYSDNIDFSLFKKDIDLATGMEIINWTFEGLSTKLWHSTLNQKIDLKEALKESHRYLAVLKELFYDSEMEN